MKKLIGLLLLFAITALSFAGIFADNIKYLGQISNAIEKHRVYSSAYFGGVDINGFHVLLTQTQKDSLKVLADIQIEQIKLYADSLEHYGQ